MRLIALCLAATLGASGAGAHGQSVTAADYARAAAVEEVGVAKLVPRSLPSYHWSRDGRTLFYEINDVVGPRRYEIDAATGRKREVAKFDAAPVGDAQALPSLDGRSELLTRDKNLWLRSGGAERQLTRDGEEHFAYGEIPDALYRSIARQTGQFKSPPFNVTWSPDGRTILGQRSDERAVKPYPYIAWNPTDGSHRPVAYSVRIALMGDPDQPITAPYVIDAASGAIRQIAAPAGWKLETTTTMWSIDGAKAWMLATSVDGHGGALFELDVAAALLRPVITERRKASFTFNAGSVYSAGNVRILGGGRQAIWFSERDGWPNLYLYDLKTGEAIRQLTHGPGVVLDILLVDDANERVFFSGEGRDPGADPYQRHLYSVSLKGGPITDLTPEPADHDLSGPISPALKIFFRTPAGIGAISPDGRWFVDAASTLDKPPVVTLRSTDGGRAIAELSRADASPLLAEGWTAPRRFHVKAADGVTDLWGGLYLPPGYDPARRYPVIDGLYAGPQVTVAPRNFNEGSGARPQMGDRNSLAALGFIVFTVDARGTPGRSSAFRDVSYGNFADPQLDDHVAVMRQLAALYPGMDLTRVGAYGHSLGGYVSTRALLRYPDVYKVAVSSAGVHAWEGFYASFNSVFGPLDYGEGRTTRPDPKAVPIGLDAIDNTALAGRLKGNLLLVYGDLDENAMPGATMTMVDALTRANKRYDLMYLANKTHAYGPPGYFEQRMWDYFVEHLMGARPPNDFTLGATATAPK